jgi:hypothetical protein
VVVVKLALYIAEDGAVVVAAAGLPFVAAGDATLPVGEETDTEGL